MILFLCGWSTLFCNFLPPVAVRVYNPYPAALTSYRVCPIHSVACACTIFIIFPAIWLLPSRFYGTAPRSNSLRKFTDLFLSLSYAAQEAFRTHHQIEIQKAKGFRAHRGNSWISYYNASPEPNDGGRASSVRNYISRCHPSCPAGTGACQSTNSGHYIGCRGVGTGWSFRAHRRYGHQFQVHGTAAFVAS